MTDEQQMRLLSRAMGGNIESREVAEGIYRHAAKETPMQWTTEFPTKPGFYWVRNYVRRWTSSKTIEGPDLVRLEPWEEAPDAGWRTLRMGQAWSGIDDIVSAEWYGPIEPPE